MRAIVAGAALLAAAPAMPQASTPGYNTQFSTAMPPARFRGDGAALVVFTSDVAAWCGAAPKPYVKIACAGTTAEGVPLIVLPNPCPAGEVGDPYAVIACHELGHQNHWTGNHEQ